MNFSQLDDHKEAYEMILVVLGHRRGGSIAKNTIITTADGKRLDTDTIIDYFNELRCPFLAGKPKIFIVEACRYRR